MSNFFKKIIGMISAVSVCLTNSVTTMAEDDYLKYQYDQDAELSMESKEQYINRIILNHLFWYESKDQLGYSNEIPYWNFSTNSIVNNCYFVFDGDQIIGELFVTDSNGEFSSTFREMDCAELQNAYDKNIGISIGNYCKNVVLFTESTGYTYVDGMFEIQFPDDFSGTTTVISREKSVMAQVEPLAQRASASKMLGVPVVGNDSSLGNGEGVCWASCVAMKMNFQNKLHLDASDVYYATRNKMHALGMDSEPTGTPSIITLAYKEYGYSVNYKSSAVTPNEVLGFLSMNKPVQISISGTRNSTGSPVYHAVIIYGISIANTSSSNTDITIFIKNPNVDRKESVSYTGNPNKIKASINYDAEWDECFYNNWFATYE